MDESKREEAPQEEKLFTQAEVNEIVRKRVERVKKKYEEAPSGADPEHEDASKAVSDTPSDDERIAELDKREKAIQLKENRSAMTEFLQKNNFPLDLLEVVDLEDIEASKKTIIKYAEAFDVTGRKKHIPSPVGGHDGGDNKNRVIGDFPGMTIAGSRHKPKTIKTGAPFFGGL